MPTKVVLTVSRGEEAGEVFEFAERASCILGRARDCSPRIPDKRKPKRISRHHCLIDINPPDVRLRDLGSLNGTRLNGCLIGKREPGESPEEGSRAVLPDFNLKDGDEIRLVDTVIRIGITLPTLCATCSAEIPDDDREATRGAENTRCAACRDATSPVSQEPPSTRRPETCSDYASELGAWSTSLVSAEAFYTACRSNPEALARNLLDQAENGEPGLLALRGYRFVRGLGGGTMGAVFLIEHDRTGESRALKLMLPRVAVKEQNRKRFERELGLIRALDHPHVVRAFGSGRAQGCYFYTMEYCRGGSLDRLIDRPGKTLPVNEALAITFQILDGLDHVHNVALSDGARGMVHRDLKPQNIVLAGPDGARVARVADFGLAKAFDAAGMSGLTRTTDVMGTPMFMTRKQVVNFKYAPPEVDVWPPPPRSTSSSPASPHAPFPRAWTFGSPSWRKTRSPSETGCLRSLAGWPT